MNKKIKKIIMLLGVVLLVIILAGMYKFNYLPSKEGYDIDGNKMDSDIVEVDGYFKFNKKTKEWSDDHGICHTCTEENGFGKDGKIITEEGVMHSSWDRNKDGINDCEDEGICDHSIDYRLKRVDGVSDERIKLETDKIKSNDKDKKIEGKYVENYPEFYKKLKILSENEFDVEISRSRADCASMVMKKCLQTRKEGEGWKLQHGDIYGFDYKEGDYYVISVIERKYDFSSSVNVPMDVSSNTWELLEIKKQIGSEGSIKN